jgi:hypothetical protein
LDNLVEELIEAMAMAAELTDTEEDIVRRRNTLFLLFGHVLPFL